MFYYLLETNNGVRYLKTSKAVRNLKNASTLINEPVNKIKAVGILKYYFKKIFDK